MKLSELARETLLVVIGATTWITISLMSYLGTGWLIRFFSGNPQAVALVHGGVGAVITGLIWAFLRRDIEKGWRVKG